MTFKENFPLLSKRKIIFDLRGIRILTLSPDEMKKRLTASVNKMQKDVEECCLDKQKVKEAIDKLLKGIFTKDGSPNRKEMDARNVSYADSDGYYGYEQALNDLKKELGL